MREYPDSSFTALVKDAYGEARGDLYLRALNRRLEEMNAPPEIKERRNCPECRKYRFMSFCSKHMPI